MLRHLAGASVYFLRDLDALIGGEVCAGGEQIVVTHCAHIMLTRQDVDVISSCSLVSRPVVVFVEDFLAFNLEDAVLGGSGVHRTALVWIARIHTVLLVRPGRVLLILHGLAMCRTIIVEKNTAHFVSTVLVEPRRCAVHDVVDLRLDLDWHSIREGRDYEAPLVILTSDVDPGTALGLEQVLSEHALALSDNFGLDVKYF